MPPRGDYLIKLIKRKKKKIGGKLEMAEDHQGTTRNGGNY
jgi:hypothetical protein